MKTSPKPVRLHPLPPQNNSWLQGLKPLSQLVDILVLSRFVGLLPFLLLIMGVPLNRIERSLAQEHPGCFMENKAGNLVLLNQVCVLPQMDAKTSISPMGGAGRYQAKIIRREKGIPVVEVLVNNRPFEMMVDTGASGIVITPTMAELAGVTVTGKAKADTPSQRDVEFDVGSVASIEVAGLVKKNLNVAIAPSLDIGLLGQNFFGDYDVTLKQDVIEFQARS